MNSQALIWWKSQTPQFRAIAGNIFFKANIMLSEEEIEIIYNTLKK